MKQHLRIFMALLVFMICGGVSFGQTTETFKFSSFISAESVSFQGDDCTITLTKGTNTSPAWVSSEARVYAGGSLVVKSEKKITKIIYTFKVNKNGTFGSVTPAGYDESTKTWSSVTGSNEVTFNMGGTKGNYGFTQLEITYAGSDKTSTKLSFGTDYDGKTVSTKVGEILETPATLTPAVSGATISYDSSDKTVAEIDKDGVVYAYKEGTTTITASYVGDDTYASSSASYTLNVEDARTVTTLTFPTSSYTFDLGSGDHKFTNVAILNPSEAGTVTYKSSNENIAVVGDDGSVVVSTDNVGTATITASFAGNGNHKASEASYTIEVKALQEAFNFENPADYGYGTTSNSPAYGTGEGDVLEGASVVAGNVKLTLTKKASSGMRFYSDGLRVYKGVTMTLSVPNGYVITKVNYEKTKGTIKVGDLNNREVAIDVTVNATLTSMTVTYAKLPTASLTTAASGFSTYAADYAVNYTEAGLKAYAVKVSDDKTKVSYTECTGIVPAGKAVLVKGEANSEYTLTPATEDADATFDTDLQISDGNVTADGTTIFAFGTKNNVSGFKIVKNGVVIPEKKGYLVVANASAAKDFFAFDDSTNGIDDPTIEIGEEEVPLFNLAGQRVGKDYKGIVVKNGKKYVNK